MGIINLTFRTNLPDGDKNTNRSRQVGRMPWSTHPIKLYNHQKNRRSFGHDTGQNALRGVGNNKFYVSGPQDASKKPNIQVTLGNKDLTCPECNKVYRLRECTRFRTQHLRA